MIASATYSPDDNKLRLYPSARLDRETYDRVKAAGFKWAPKQDLFVAPMWTPERADLCVELAGEISDEDTSLAQRAEERAERFEDYSESRAADSDAASKAAHGMLDMMNGQPILVGHHSEKRHRRDLARVDRNLARAAENYRAAQYWQRRAQAAIAHAKYKERPAVRARRIKKIEADDRKVRKSSDMAAAGLKLWQSFGDSVTHAQADHVLTMRDMYYRPAPGADFTSMWRALRDGELTPGQAREHAIRIFAGTAESCQRWIEHYAGRLEYERAMLAADGGTVTDRQAPEKGGAVRVWTFRNGWSYVVKVNKVSVTVYDNWGNGGANFTRTIPFDKIGGVMSAAEVAEARQAGRLSEDSTGKGFYLIPAADAAEA